MAGVSPNALMASIVPHGKEAQESLKGGRKSLKKEVLQLNACGRLTLHSLARALFDKVHAASHIVGERLIVEATDEMNEGDSLAESCQGKLTMKLFFIGGLHARQLREIEDA